MNEEYRQALDELNTARVNYSETDKSFEKVAYHNLKAAEERVVAIIKEIKGAKRCLRLQK